MQFSKIVFKIKFLIFTVFIFSFFACDKSEKEFKNAKEIGTIDVFENFINKYPQSNWIQSAEIVLDSLRYQTVVTKDSISLFENFITQYPDSRFMQRAEVILDSLRYQQVKSKDSLEVYIKFIENYPKTAFLEQAKNKIEQLKNEKIKQLHELKAKQLEKALKDSVIIYITEKQMNVIKSLPNELVCITSRKNPVKTLEGIKNGEFAVANWYPDVPQKLLAAFGRPDTPVGLFYSGSGIDFDKKENQNYKIFITHQSALNWAIPDCNGIKIVFKTK